MQKLLITGGAGFIGSAFIRYLLRSTNCSLINVDLLTYAANLAYLPEWENHPRYRFVQGDIGNQSLMEELFSQVDTVVHFAAETHVDRSIATAAPFISTNICGTFSLLEALRKSSHVHFHHISTDEVYGALPLTGFFHELSPYRPNSPYAASKAASDHLVRAYAHTYGLSTTISHCSNNYGPGQHPEKFIPRMIQHCLENKPLPVYGQGDQIRDWLFVDDHAAALWLILQKGKKGETYDLGSGNERTNLSLLTLLIDLLAAETATPSSHYRSLIQFTPDRPGHDFRYAIDFSKTSRELGWHPTTSLEEGLKITINTYLSQYSPGKL